jgi:hypothetical protein
VVSKAKRTTFHSSEICVVGRGACRPKLVKDFFLQAIRDVAEGLGRSLVKDVKVGDAFRSEKRAADLAAPPRVHKRKRVA